MAGYERRRATGQLASAEARSALAALAGGACRLAIQPLADRHGPELLAVSRQWGLAVRKGRGD